MNRSRIGARWFITRGVAMLVLLGAYYAVPARAAQECDECVWQWNGSDYESACEPADTGGYAYCLADWSVQMGYFCWLDDQCVIPD